MNYKISSAQSSLSPSRSYVYNFHFSSALSRFSPFGNHAPMVDAGGFKAFDRVLSEYEPFLFQE